MESLAVKMFYPWCLPSRFKLSRRKFHGEKRKSSRLFCGLAQCHITMKNEMQQQDIKESEIGQLNLSSSFRWTPAVLPQWCPNNLCSSWVTAESCSNMSCGWARCAPWVIFAAGEELKRLSRQQGLALHSISIWWDAFARGISVREFFCRFFSQGVLGQGKNQPLGFQFAPELDWIWE